MAGAPSRLASLIGGAVGNYTVKALIGRGATGTVYLAWDRVLNRQVALKVLLGSLAHNPDQVRRFHREAQSAAPLKHPHIVGIYEAGVSGGVPFIAMEYVEGESLERFMTRKGPLSWQHALQLCHQVAQALSCAHAAGLIHRDVKPANVLLDRQGRARLTDFGIARVHEQEEGGETWSDFLGTPQYMAPEQCEGVKLTPRTDLFALGVTLYEMLAGKKPFLGRTHAALIHSITTEEPPRVSQVMMGIPDDVARLVAHLMQKDPAQRLASAEELCARIEHLQRENGGKSALPEALRAYIREEMRPRAVAVDTPTPAKRLVPALRLAPSRRRYIPISAMAQASAALLVGMAVLAAAYWRIAKPAAQSIPAPLLGDLAFAQTSPGLWSAPLPDAAWRIDTIAWAGELPLLLVRVVGEPGSAAQGTAGLLAYDPVSQNVRSLRAPEAPNRQEQGDSPRMLDVELPMLPAMPAAAPLAGALPVHSAMASRGEVVTLAQSLDQAGPAAAVLCSLPAPRWNARAASPWALSESGRAVPKPDGTTVCLVLNDEAAQSSYLAERDVRWAEAGRTGPRLTPSGARIVPESVQYSPAGTWIVYQQSAGASGHELWLTRSGGDEQSARPLAHGRLGGVAFSPNESLLAVTVYGPEQARILILRVADGSVAGDAASGELCAESWHPSGNYLVVCDADPAANGRKQLWAVETKMPYRRTRLCEAEGGIEGPVAVSREGRWAAASTRRDGIAAVVFVDLSSVLFALQA